MGAIETRRSEWDPLAGSPETPLKKPKITTWHNLVSFLIDAIQSQ